MDQPEMTPELTDDELVEVDSPEDPELEADAAQEQVRMGIYVSAIRCLITYVLAPALGAAGVLAGFLGVAAVGLQILGAVLCTFGAIKLWKLKHRARYLYAGVAVAVYLSTAITLAGLG